MSYADVAKERGSKFDIIKREKRHKRCTLRFQVLCEMVFQADEARRVVKNRNESSARGKSAAIWNIRRDNVLSSLEITAALDLVQLGHKVASISMPNLESIEDVFREGGETLSSRHEMVEGMCDWIRPSLVKCDWEVPVIVTW